MAVPQHDVISRRGFPHTLADFEFSIIEQLCNLSDNNNSLDDRLLTREAYWCAQLCTLRPHGLNKRCEFNSRNRIRYIIIINTILLLDFIVFYLRYSGCFNCIYLLRNSFLSFYRLRNSYGILCKIF